ncbi:MAG: UvrD-helicase domain-containing protein [Flavobacteriales bacterium]|nr:UvrD-helicase domain-containing protein [Flavobacteriales bacterium]
MFQVLRSSAGAGKTHALVKHYLGLCLRGANPQDYRQVLALTFTTKAATEMKERVLGYLEGLARNDTSHAGLRDVMEHIISITGTDADGVAERARAVLDHMLNHYSDVAISTIDAFTRRVVRPFARDLQLDHDLRMATDQDWYLDRAVEDVIAEAGLNPDVTALLTEACQMLLEEEAAWDPERSLRELGKELDKERSIAPLKALASTSPEDMIALAGRLRERNNAFIKRMRELGQDTLRLLDEAGLKPEDLYQGARGYHGFLTKLARFGDALMLPNSYAQKAMESGTWWSGKADASAKARLEAIAPQLQARIAEATDALAAEQRDYFVRKAILHRLPTAFTLHELHRCLEARKAEEGVVFFSDLTRRVAELVQDEPVPFIYERLGERYRHFLIDEFQDTSLLQWTTLLPLIHNALGTGGSALLVGDAKQAIYRWRNGEVRLFLELPRLFGSPASDVTDERERALLHHHRETEPLASNFRSAATIIHFNNALFAHTRTALPPSLARVYQALEQNAANEREGLVRIERQPKDVTGEDAKAMRDAFMLRCVQEAVADGFAAGDIAVLVRTGAQGREAAEALTAAGYPITSPDGLLLSNDPLVESVLELLRVIASDDRTAALRALQHMARQRADQETHEVDPYPDAERAKALHAAVKSWLGEYGLSGVSTTLTDLISRMIRALGSVPQTDARALALLDEAHAFSVEHGPDLTGFLQHWERKGQLRSLSPPEDGQSIQVMTVHKAKGLEFPVVIVPHARMASTARHGEHLWISPSEADAGLPFALVTDSTTLRDLGLPESEEERDLRILDAMDLLYVAFTRPVQRLYALVPERGADDVTKAVLDYMDASGASESLILGERSGPWRVKPTAVSERFDAMPNNTGRGLAALRSEAPETWDPADPDPLRSQGNLIHELLSAVRHAQDLPAVIERMISRGELTGEEGHAIEARLLPLLSSPQLADWFGPRVDSRTEATIITAEGQVQRPDRVVFEGGGARVLDLKTGAPAESHAKQVRSYMNLLRELGYAPVEGALLYLSTGELQPIPA